MKILFLGPAVEGRGFALAGVAAEACATELAAARALALARRPDSGVGLVLLSPVLGGLAAQPAAGRAGAPPAILVLPSPEPRAAAAPGDPR